ncbi:MAG: hypothetical protein J7484_09215 [Microbacterium sp.]|nr:hypothetical protein [Microbacterium sp.]
MTAVFTRRSALGAGAVALGAGLVGSGRTAAFATTDDEAPDAAADATATPSDAGAGAPASADPLLPTRSLFAGHEGREYHGASSWSEHRLVLDGVGDLPGGGDAENRFSVTFTTDEDARDGIYRLLHEGELVASLFLAKAGGTARLEGIVDRSVRA